MADTIKTNIGGKDNSNETCFYKCKYDFVYLNIGTCNAINQENMIQLDYPENRNETIKYNNLTYSPRQIFIYYPSYFNYYDTSNINGKKADAEISIYHTNESSSPLIVNIPIYISTDTNSVASSLVTEIIKNVSKNAPGKNEQTTINFVNNFSLKNIIPVKPFYTFYDTTKSSKYIIFGNENSINISSDTYNNMLSKILKEYTASSTKKNNQFIYYNLNGPNSNPEENDIYISCNPTGNSEDTKKVVYDIDIPISKSSLYNKEVISVLNNFFQSKNGMITIICVSILIIVLIYLGFQNYLTVNA